jgi:hypothetical protein
MKKTIEVELEEDQNQHYPNSYAPIPPNKSQCPHTGLRHTHLYSLLSLGGEARPYVRVVNLKKSGTKKGKTLFHVGDFLRFMDRLAVEQKSGALRNPMLSATQVTEH